MQADTTDDYDEYCHYVAGLVSTGLPKLFHAYGLEDFADENLSNTRAVILQEKRATLKVEQNTAVSLFLVASSVGNFVMIIYVKNPNLIAAERKYYKRLSGGH